MPCDEPVIRLAAMTALRKRIQTVGLSASARGIVGEYFGFLLPVIHLLFQIVLQIGRFLCESSASNQEEVL